jgi:hypothetical protein
MRRCRPPWPDVTGADVAPWRRAQSTIDGDARLHGGSAPARRTPWAMRGPDQGIAGDSPQASGTFHRRPDDHRGIKRFGEPHLPPPRPERSGHPDRVHDRGRCPLYVRAQLDAVGLSGTQWDLVRPKATAREAGKIQLTGYFRRWWQVLGSNQRRLSRRFTNRRHFHQSRPSVGRSSSDMVRSIHICADWDSVR